MTGGAGFMGAHLARALQDMGREVVILDDLFGLIYVVFWPHNGDGEVLETQEYRGI